MIRLDPTLIKFKEEMVRFSNNLLLITSYKKATCSVRSLDRWLSVVFSQGIRILAQGRMNEYVYMCILEG